VSTDKDQKNIRILYFKYCTLLLLAVSLAAVLFYDPGVFAKAGLSNIGVGLVFLATIGMIQVSRKLHEKLKTYPCSNCGNYFFNSEQQVLFIGFSGLKCQSCGVES
jgi:hypothetical protein